MQQPPLHMEEGFGPQLWEAMLAGHAGDTGGIGQGAVRDAGAAPHPLHILTVCGATLRSLRLLRPPCWGPVASAMLQTCHRLTELQVLVSRKSPQGGLGGGRKAADCQGMDAECRNWRPSVSLSRLLAPVICARCEVGAARNCPSNRSAYWPLH